MLLSLEENNEIRAVSLGDDVSSSRSADGEDRSAPLLYNKSHTNGHLLLFVVDITCVTTFFE